MSNYTERVERYRKLKNIAYYLIIGVVSIISVVFLPLLNSEAELSFEFPDTPAGWIVFGITRLSIALINVLIYFSFMQQAKVNVKEDPKYLEAKQILDQRKIVKEIKPRGPKEWTALQYTKKTSMIVIASALSVVGLTNAILSFDLVVFLSYTFTVVMGLIFGYLQMRKAEDYWTDEFWLYAKEKEKETEKQAEIDLKE